MFCVSTIFSVTRLFVTKASSELRSPVRRPRQPTSSTETPSQADRTFNPLGRWLRVLDDRQTLEERQDGRTLELTPAFCIRPREQRVTDLEAPDAVGVEHHVAGALAYPQFRGWRTARFLSKFQYFVTHLDAASQSCIGTLKW